MDNFIKLMNTLSQYISNNHVDGGRCMVLGLAPSLNDYLALNDHHLFEIGVNNIKSVYVPDTVLVVDPIGSFQKHKLANMDYGQTPFVTPHPKDWGKYCKNIVSYEFAGYDIESDFGTNYGSDFINVGHTSTFCALILASYLGYTEIGMIGVDMTRGHCYDKEDTKLHPLNRILNKVNEEFLKLNRVFRENGIEVFNLSSQSLVTAFPKKSIESFIND